MVLIKSSSGIRGTLGGKEGDGFTPIDIIKFSAGYVSWMKKKYKKNKYLIIFGRDGRITSTLFQKFLIITFQNFGINVIDVGLSTTPTVGLSIIHEKADGGIMLTASHNKKNWNGLKMFNSMGEFLSEKDFQLFYSRIKKKYIHFVPFQKLGNYLYKKNYIHKHIKTILSLPLVDIKMIQKARFKIVVDGINSTGGIAVPLLLENLGVKVIKIYCTPNGDFRHHPEPIKKNLSKICKKVYKIKADLGIAVDPDVDRVVFINENGDFFGEEYTLITISDYILGKKLGPIVSTLSSSKALYDLSVSKGVPYYDTPVGEVHVIKKMKKVKAVIGGEGNGGIIYPNLRYGRDALVGIALFLSYLSKLPQKSLIQLKKRYTNYFMSKKKIKLSSFQQKKQIFNFLKKKYKGKKMNFQDGIKIYLKNEWIHIRQSNTENIIRIHIESTSKKRVNFLYKKIFNKVKNYN